MRAPRSRIGLRRAVGALAVVALVLGPALAAQAHVHVVPDSTTAGSTAELAFRVPSESPTASTTALTVTLPQEHPFSQVSARVTAGWTVNVGTAALPAPVLVGGTTLTRAAHTVTWTARPGFTIPPGQYQEFSLSVGPLPDSGDVVFTATQTYSDGTVVAWDQPTTGASEPDHPAPSFPVTSASDAQASAGAAATGAEAAGTGDAAAVDAAATTSDSFSRWLGGAGLLSGLGAIGLIVARRSPRRTPRENPEKQVDLRTAGA